MTVAVASYQRREALGRLLAGLRQQLLAEPDLQQGLDVVIVLDGSMDGSLELLEQQSFPVPLRALWQRNAGLASARNAGWRISSAELVWFLDDDLVPADGLVRAHRSAHADDSCRVLLGPCVIPTDAATLEDIRGWWDERYAELARDGVTRFDQFSAANASLPRQLLEEVGGFDERFVGYGREDYELGLRILDRGLRVDFDPQALAWHEQSRTAVEYCRLRREEGRNVVRFIRLHADCAADVLGVAPGPVSAAAVGPRLLRPVRWLLLPVVARVVSALLHALGAARDPRRRMPPMEELCFALGVMEADTRGDVTMALSRKLRTRPRSPTLAH